MACNISESLSRAVTMATRLENDEGLDLIVSFFIDFLETEFKNPESQRDIHVLSFIFSALSITAADLFSSGDKIHFRKIEDYLINLVNKNKYAEISLENTRLVDFNLPLYVVGALSGVPTQKTLTLLKGQYPLHRPILVNR